MFFFCSNWEYSIYLQFFIDRMHELVQCKHMHMLRWRRFCEHTSTIEALHPYFNDRLVYVFFTEDCGYLCCQYTRTVCNIYEVRNQLNYIHNHFFSIFFQMHAEYWVILQEHHGRVQRLYLPHAAFGRCTGELLGRQACQLNCSRQARGFADLFALACLSSAFTKALQSIYEGTTLYHNRMHIWLLI